MSMYLKALGIHVYFATIKDSYFLNSKNLETNAKAALHALKSTLNDEYLSRVSNFDSAFVVWNILVLKLLYAWDCLLTHVFNQESHSGTSTLI